MAIKNKKGFYFTTAAIALSIIIIFSLKIHTQYGLKDKMDSIEIRISTMNDFIKDIENDVDNAIFIVGFRSLLSLEDYMMENNEPTEDPKFFILGDLGITLSNAFDEVFRLGTINSEKMSLMVNNTFLNWTNKIKDEATKIDIVIDFTVDEATITQTEPWVVDISVDLIIDIQDKKNIASWTINKIYTKKINIIGFVDPLYLVNTNGVANNTIRKTTATNFPADLSSHLANVYYIEQSNAPSYLDRFENILTPDSNGIESLVTQKLKDEGLPVATTSAVDYIYFGTPNPPECNIVDIADTDFYLDDPDHTAFYNTACV